MSRPSRKRCRSSSIDYSAIVDSTGAEGVSSETLVLAENSSAVENASLDNKECDHAIDYSSAAYWKQRYGDGVAPLEWYCGFQHLHPLFDRFVPKVCTKVV